MSYGKSGGTSTTNQLVSPAQQQQLGTQTSLFTDTMAPALQQAVGGATNVYNAAQGGVNTAAQNQATTAGQVQQALGGQGATALTTGLQGLQNVFSPDYEQNQINAAMGTANQQFQQNMANQGAQFGGAGQLGSARQALAQGQLAETQRVNNAQQAANIQNQIAQQRAGVGQNLATLGMQGLQGALSAAGTGVQAAQTPMDLYGKYMGLLNQVPQAAYSPNFAGTQTTVTGQDTTKSGISI